jgi:hypothetical protein
MNSQRNTNIKNQKRINLLYKMQKSNNLIFNIIIRFMYDEHHENNDNIKHCIGSVLNQSLANYKIYVIVDDKKCLPYLKKFKKDINIIFQKTNYLQGYRNIFLNKILAQINGWAIILDIVNTLRRNALLTIFDKIKSDDDFCIWKYKKNNKTIFSKKIRKMELCTIAFHTKHLKNNRFVSCNNGVERFLNSLITSNKFNFVFIERAIVTNSVQPNLLLLTDIRDKVDNVSNNYLSTITNGGIGNKLFMIFNLISLSKDYNIPFSFEDDLTYDRRPHSFKYSLFDTLDSHRIKNIVPYTSLREKEFKYNKIEINNVNNSYLLEGYFQSYKYFWHNKDIIKKHLFVNTKRIDILRNTIKNYNKKTIALHMRLGDYKNLTNYHPLQPIEYYKKVLSNYNLDEYVIFLFSDEPKLAEEKLSDLNINIINANNLFTDDEDHLFMISLCDVKICCNSSFSLMACYLNEIFNFVDDSQYIFPDHWFGKDGPKYDLTDIIPINNKRFKIVSLKKVAVIFFHKNIYDLYDKRWIDKSVQSILSQKYDEFDIYEINYGNSPQSIFENTDISMHKYNFYTKNYETHTEAMIFLLNEAFKNDYDIVFNTNLDDYYHNHRFIYQLLDLQYSKSVLSSSLWTYIKQNDNDNDRICKSSHANTITVKDNNFVWNKYNKILEFDDPIYSGTINYDAIKRELLNKNNIINHPSLCFTKEFWNSTDKYGNKLCYRDDKPYEDLSLWTRSVQNNIPISIVNKNLVYYRIHDNQIGTQKQQQENNNTVLSTFKKEPNMVDTRTGYLYIIERTHDISTISDVIKDDYKTFFLFFYIKEKLVDKLNEFIDRNNISNFKTVTYKKKETSIDDIKKRFDVSLQMCCDTLIVKKSMPEIAFFTTIYKIKSKFDFQTYETWGKKLLSKLKNYKLFIFTNQETYELIKHLTNHYTNIEFIIKELTDFEYHSERNVLKKNTKKKYFPNHDISFLLILLWINRHVLYNEIKKRHRSDFYSHIDWGYFRACDDNSALTIDTTKLLTNKIYFGLIKNDTKYIRKLYNKFKDWDKESIEKTLVDNLYSVGGGATIIHRYMIDLWISMFKDIFRKFIDKNIDFKDDQTIISSCIFNPTYYKHFALITQGKGNWFPFIKFLNNPDNDELIKNDFSFLF